MASCSRSTTRARGVGYRAMWQRVPVGPCAFITPWNFPLNLVAHKIAPAIACGCPFVLKPASYTPISALILGEILAETDLPAGAFSILPMKASDSAALVEDERIRKLSFTGSPRLAGSCAIERTRSMYAGTRRQCGRRDRSRCRH